MPYPASAIAYAFVKKGIEEGKFVTQMKVQKLLFFAQGYHLAKFGEPLIIEEFEAWQYGPVVPNIYEDYKLYGSKLITDTDFAPRFKTMYLDYKAQDAIQYTWDLLKDISAMALSNWTHQPETPWSLVYSSNSKSTPIDNTAIKKYFEDLLTVSNN